MIRFSPTLTMQYDTAFSPFSAAEFEAGLQWAKAAGFDGVEVCISHYHGLDIPALRARLDELGLGCSTLSTGQSRTLENLSLLHEDAAQVKATQQRLMEHIDAAALLGSKVTLGLLRGLGTVGNEAAQKKRLAEAMKPLVEYAAQKDVTLVLEAINRYETALLNSVEETASFIRDDLGGPTQVKILWDVFHANIEDVSMAAAAKAAGSRLGHVHFADSNRMFPGYGHIDFAEVYRLLLAMGFDGYISFECLNRPSVQAVREQSAGFIAGLRKITL